MMKVMHRDAGYDDADNDDDEEADEDFHDDYDDEDREEGDGDDEDDDGALKRPSWLHGLHGHSGPEERMGPVLGLMDSAGPVCPMSPVSPIGQWCQCVISSIFNN
eukprot:792322-Karenia_brevis.AAC.1